MPLSFGELTVIFKGSVKGFSVRSKPLPAGFAQTEPVSEEQGPGVSTPTFHAGSVHRVYTGRPCHKTPTIQIQSILTETRQKTTPDRHASLRKGEVVVGKSTEFQDTKLPTSNNRTRRVLEHILAKKYQKPTQLLGIE